MCDIHFVFPLPGKDKFGFGYGGTAKKSTASQFDDYGEVSTVVVTWGGVSGGGVKVGVQSKWEYGQSGWQYKCDTVKSYFYHFSDFWQR